jgi:predicted restriction endonuclease
LAEEPADYAIISEAGMNSIDREVTTKSRGIAQRLFRGNLLRLWQGSCAVTSVQEPRVLRSSHIKPWTTSNVREKVDHFNGLLLVPNLDTLFNEGLISFQDDGRMLVSDDWQAGDKRRMHITSDLHLRKVHPESRPYMEFHRDVLFKRVSAGESDYSKVRL